ncbi:MAG: endonuclease NucS domain-containing protein [Candidatus Helarchaeota archaeon]
MFYFTQEQIDNLKLWINNLQSPQAQKWLKEEEIAEVEIQKFLKDKEFQKKDLNSDDFDKFFKLMKQFSSNRTLNKLLYINNGIDEFNKKLKNLYYGSDPFAKRVDDFFRLQNIGSQTLSQFLLAFNPKKYPLITYITKEVLALDIIQEQEAINEAYKRFQINNPQNYLKNTIKYLSDTIIFEKIKELLNLDKFNEVNLTLWLAQEKLKEQPDELIESYTSVSLEKDLRDYLAENPSIIEKGLKLIEKEYDTKEAGKIDLLCEDEKGYHVVIELKKGKGHYSVIGQISSYLGWVKQNLNEKVRGIIIISEPDVKLDFSIDILGDLIKLKYYRVKFEITDEYEQTI